MPQIPHWADAESDDSWDALILGGKFIPGVPSVKVKRPVTKIDKQKAKGKAGAKPKNQGADPATVDITITLINRADLEALEQVLDMLVPKKSGEVNPLEIQHPAANVVGVTQIIIENISTSQPNAKDGWKVDIDAVEYTPSPEASKGLGGLQGGGAGSATSCPAISAQIQAATSERESLQAALQDAISNYAQLQGNQQLVSTSQLANAKARMNELNHAYAQAVAREAALKDALAKKCPNTSSPPSADAKEKL